MTRRVTVYTSLKDEIVILFLSVLSAGCAISDGEGDCLTSCDGDTGQGTSVDTQDDVKLPPFVGDFDCRHGVETFAGDQSSGQSVTEMLLQAADLGGGQVRWLSPGSRENVFQDCPAILDVDGEQASFLSGEGCGHLLSSGSAELAEDGGFYGLFDGSFGGYPIEVEVDCAPAAVSLGGEAFYGRWSCSGDVESFHGGGVADFVLSITPLVTNVLRVEHVDGDMTAFVACSTRWDVRSSTHAALAEDGACSVSGFSTPESSGLNLACGVLSGDFGGEQSFGGIVSFSCTR